MKFQIEKTRSFHICQNILVAEELAKSYDFFLICINDKNAYKIRL